MSTGRGGVGFKAKERAEFNQYWYSAPTIDAIVAEVVASSEAHTGADPFVAAFLSTPSVYGSIPRDGDLFANAVVLDFDAETFGSEPGFVLYDYNKPDELPEELVGKVDLFVVDPPFITEEVWMLYAEAIRKLRRDESSRVLASTILENAELLESELGVVPAAFQPSIPHLVYQYHFFVNYEPTALAVENPEIP